MSEVITLPPPMGGLNYRESADALTATDAIRLNGWFPEIGYIRTFYSPSSHATGVGASSASVQFLANFDVLGTQYLIGGASNKLYDATSAGAATDITNGATITSNKWQHAQFDDASGGARLGLVNGANAPLQIDGTLTVTTLTISGSGLTPANLIGIGVHRSRTYFWTDNSQDFWYSATNALGGALTKFPLGRVTGFGGKLVAFASWSPSGGDQDNLAAFLMSDGSVIVYAGSDPSSATDWSLVGVYKMGRPLGHRCTCRVRGDVLVLTTNGVESLSQNLSVGQSPMAGLGAKINQALKNYIRGYDATASYFGCQMVACEQQGQLVVSLPVSEGADQSTWWIMNLNSGAWCSQNIGTASTDIRNTHVLAEHKSTIYFGALSTTTDNVVYKYEGGGAVTYTATMAPGWDYFGGRGARKLFNAVRPQMYGVAATMTWAGAIYTDHDNTSGHAFDAGQFSLTQHASTLQTIGAYKHMRDWRTYPAVGQCAHAAIEVTAPGSSIIVCDGVQYLIQRLRHTAL